MDMAVFAQYRGWGFMLTLGSLQAQKFVTAYAEFLKRQGKLEVPG
jgi:hypothetical protein